MSPTDNCTCVWLSRHERPPFGGVRFDPNCPTHGGYPLRKASMANRQPRKTGVTMKDENRGQSKVHEAHRTNPDTGQPETKTFTQAEWKQRDKSEGWSRDDMDADGPDDAPDADDDPGETPQAPPTDTVQ